MSADIRELEADEAPSAALVTRKDGRSKYRSFQGNLYAVLGRFSDFRNGVGSKRFLRRTGLEQILLEEALSATVSEGAAAEDAESFTVARRLADFGIPLEHRNSDSFLRLPSPENTWLKLPDALDLRLTVNGQADLAEWANRVTELVNRVFVCEESVCARVDEPAIALHLQRGGVYAKHGDSGFYRLPGQAPGWSERSNLYWTDLRDQCFPITEWERAKDFASTHLRATGDQRARFSSDIEAVEIFDQTVFRFDFESAELQRLADRVWLHATRALRLPSRPSHWKKRAPTEVVSVLDSLDEARDVEKHGYTRLENELCQVLHTFNRLKVPLASAGLNADEFANAISRGLERWDDRPIDLQTAAASTKPNQPR